MHPKILGFFLLQLMVIKAEVMQSNKVKQITGSRTGKLERLSKYGESPGFLANRAKRFGLNGSKNKEFKELLRLRQEEVPFWGARGRRYDTSNEINKIDDLVEGSVGDGPFWGNRGRRDELPPLWTSRGRRPEENDKLINYDEMFWGSRGRRQDSGKENKDDQEGTFWGQRGRREYSLPSQERKEGRNDANKLEIIEDLLKQQLFMKAVDPQKSRTKREISPGSKGYGSGYGSFWSGNYRNGFLANMFKDKNRLKSRVKMREIIGQLESSPVKDIIGSRHLRQDRLYVDEPYYILVDRSSRSGDDDPYFISRGKKTTFDFAKAARERRGLIEEIAKLKHPDPYYIARGKKDYQEDEAINLLQSTCLSSIEGPANRPKRNITDNDRATRTILKKLADGIMNDPFFISRGKKSDNFIDDELSNDDLNMLCALIFD